MLNTLIISDHYASLISHQWSIAYCSASIVTIIFVLVFAYLSGYILDILENPHAKLFSHTKYIILDTCAIATFIIAVLVGVHWLFLPNINSGRVHSPAALAENNYSHYTIPHTAYIINHNHKILPYEWKYDEYLAHHVGKEPSHDHIALFRSYKLKKHHQIIYEKKLYKQEHFDEVNSKFCTKHYVKEPTWIDYL